MLPLRGDVNAQLGGDAAAVGPYLVSHLGLPTWLVILYVSVILSACYSVIDSAFTATSSVFVVDIIKPLFPKIGEKQLFFWAKAPMFLTAVIAAAVILTGADFVTIVLTSYAIRTATLIPLVLALFWSRTTGWGFVGGTILAIAIGMPIRSVAGELWGSLSILAISAAVPLVIGYLRNLRFDFERLRHVKTRRCLRHQRPSQRSDHRLGFIAERGRRSIMQNIEIPGIQGLFDSIIYAKGGAPVTVREASLIYAEGMGMPRLVGTAADIVDQLEHFMDEGGADGFMLAATYTPGCFEEFVDLAVPELQRRGRFRTEYSGPTLRENLLAY